MIEIENVGAENDPGEIRGFLWPEITKVVKEL
jgi:hypothetical protein